MKTEITKRSTDNQYMLWGYTVDPTYDPSEITERNISFIPQRWIILGVYNERRQAHEKQLELTAKRTR